jgi:hypothetical protein
VILAKMAVTTAADGITHTVQADNRDLAALRRRGWRDCGLEAPAAASELLASQATLQADPLLAQEVMLWLAWNAGTRDGLWAWDFDTFVEQQVTDLDVNLDAGSGLDPSTAAPSDTSSGS